MINNPYTLTLLKAFDILNCFDLDDQEISIQGDFRPHRDAPELRLPDHPEPGVRRNDLPKQGDQKVSARDQVHFTFQKTVLSEQLSPDSHQANGTPGKRDRRDRQSRDSQLRQDHLHPPGGMPAYPSPKLCSERLLSGV